MTKYITMMSRAKMPGSCMGGMSYCNIAVVEIDTDLLNEGDDRPRMISTRARGVVRIVEAWREVHVGKTPRSEGVRAMMEAEELCRRLNNAKD